MTLRPAGFIEMPAHRTDGGFDHAAVHRQGRRLYVAHTANDALDVIDLATERYAGSIEGLGGVAGALVDEASGLVFTSNRGEDTVGIFDPDRPADLVRVPVGVRPNGLAFDPGRRRLLAANVGDPVDPATHTVSIVDVERRALVGSVRVPGRTRWTVFDPVADAFYVNIADPAVIVVLGGADPSVVERTIEVPTAGPHGLDVDADGSLFCATDAGRLYRIGPGGVGAEAPLAGSPDVIFLDRELRLVFVAIGDPGVIEVFDADTLDRLDAVETERGAHTIGFAPDTHRIYAFLPLTHRAAVFAASRPTT